MDYQKINISCSEQTAEFLPFVMETLPFEVWEESEGGVAGYIPVGQWSETIADELNEYRKEYEFEWSNELIPARNWNEEWESNFEPVSVGDFCHIRATFHQKPTVNYRHEIVIAPRMAFGTGHHATTRQMIQMMGEIELKNQTVFDYGCGTGILAIMAAKLGASKIDAIDIDSWAVENTEEHADLNHILTPIDCRCSTLEESPFLNNKYDVILANINKNVILNSLSSLSSMVVADGYLLVSGILDIDHTDIVNAANKCGFKKIKHSQELDWQCILFQKNIS